MDLSLIVSWLLCMVLLAVFIIAREMILFNVKWMLKKKKGGIPSIIISEDKNVKLDVVSPNDDGEIRADEGPKKAKKVTGEKTYWFEPFDSRLVFEREGDADIYDPYEGQSGSSITADTVDRIAKRAKLQGAIDEQKNYQQLRNMLFISIGINVIAAIMIFITMQGVGDVQGMLEEFGRQPVQQAMQ